MPASRSVSFELPPPEAEAQAASLMLIEKIRETIHENAGALPFESFMSMALYTPGLGYYSGGARKFGESGDFVTAPEISPLFAQCLGEQYRQLADHMGGADILEFGAGSGVLAADLLQSLDASGVLPERYLILEVSAALRARQQALLQQRVPALLERVEWLDHLPQGFRGVVFANEVLDAMPVCRFRGWQGGIQEQLVIEQGEGFGLVWRDSENRVLNEAVTRCFPEGVPEGYESEVNLNVAPWVRALSDAIEQGVAFLIDYGYGRPEYYHPQRDQGTLICHYRHRVHQDPLVYPGLQDITASVDFTAVAETGLMAGMALAGYASQAFFLMGCGLEQRVADSDPEDVVRHLELVQAVKRLTLPTEMGERFKVMALSKGVDLPMRGFALRQERERL